jgi:hypothetical protein
MSISSKRAAVIGVLALLGLGAVTGPARAAEETGWRIATVSPTYSGDEFRDVAATSPDDAWAVGEGPCCGTDDRQVSHWDGASWRPVALPAVPQDVRYPSLSAVGASSANDVWVFGKGMDGPAFGHHWDGTAWQTTVLGEDDDIKDSAVIGPADVWVAGTGTAYQPLVEHYDGAQWTDTPLPATLWDVDAISASATDDVWLMGSDATGPVMLHWTGSEWHTVALPPPPLDDGVRVAAQDVLATGPHDAWATGALTHEGVVPGPVLWHWNGRCWSLVRLDAPDDSLNTLASDGDGGVWVVSSGPRPGADLLHYSGGTLTREPVPAEPGTTPDVRELALIPGTRSLWGVGALTNDGDAAAVVYRYDPAS